MSEETNEMSTSLRIDSLNGYSVGLQQFLDGAMKGMMHFPVMDLDDESEHEPEIKFVGSGQTPVSKGLSEGYSPEDIVHFYIACELGKSWLAHLKVAFKEFCHDVQFEKRFAGPEMYCCNNLKKEDL